MRRRTSVALVAAAVLGGLVVWPASPAAAEEYDGTCGFGVSDGVWEITSGDGQAEPGGTFTLSNLRMQSTSGEGSFADVELVVSVGDLDGQVIDMGGSFVIDEGPESGHRVWDEVPPFTLEAPEGLGTHPITAELVFYDFPNVDTTCELEGEPFAEVVVSDDPPPTTTTTTTTTTTVPDANGNGDNGNGNGDNGDNGNGENGNGTPGVPPGEEAEEDAVEDAVDEIAREVAAAERALTVGAAPRFAG